MELKRGLIVAQCWRQHLKNLIVVNGLWFRVSLLVKNTEEVAEDRPEWLH